MSKDFVSLINILKTLSSLDKNDLDFFIKNYTPNHEQISIYSMLQLKDDSSWPLFLKLYQKHINKLDFIKSNKGYNISFLSLLFTSEHQNIFELWLNDDLTCFIILTEVHKQYKNQSIIKNEQIQISNFFLNQIFHVATNIEFSPKNLFLMKEIIKDHSIPLNDLPPFFDQILIDQTSNIPDFAFSNPNLKILNHLNTLGTSDFADRYYQIQGAQKFLNEDTNKFLDRQLKKCKLSFPEYAIRTGFEFLNIEESLLIKNKPLKKELYRLFESSPSYAETLFNIIKILKNVLQDFDEQIILNEILNSQKQKRDLTSYWHWSTHEFKTIQSICFFLKKEYDLTRIFKLLNQITLTESIEIHVDLLKQLENDLSEALDLIPDLKPFPDKPKTFTEIHNALNYLPKNIKDNRLIPVNSVFKDWDGMTIGDFQVYLPKTEADLVTTGTILSFCVGQKNYRDDAISGTSIFLILMNKKKEPKYCIELSKQKNSSNTIINDVVFLNGILQHDEFGYRNRHVNHRFNQLEEMTHLIMPHKKHYTNNKWKIIQAKGFQNSNVPDSLKSSIQEKLNQINNDLPNISSRDILKADIFQKPEFYILLFRIMSEVTHYLLIGGVLVWILYKLIY